MAIRIMDITGDDGIIKNVALDDLTRHTAIATVKWIDEAAQSSGITTREKMYDWLVNKRGLAYVRDRESQEPIPVFGRITPSGQYLIQAGKNGEWSTDLIDQLPKQTPVPPVTSPPSLSPSPAQ